MKNILRLLLILLLVSCGSRTKKQNTATVLEKSNVEKVNQTETLQHASQEITGQEIKLQDDFSLNIEPVNGLPAYFRIFQDGKKIEGETTGKMSFENKKKETKTYTKTLTKTYTIQKTYTKLKTYTIRQIVYRTKTVNKDHYPYWQFVLGSIVVWELLKLLIKRIFKF